LKGLIKKEGKHVIVITILRCTLSVLAVSLKKNHYSSFAHGEEGLLKDSTDYESFLKAQPLGQSYLINFETGALKKTLLICKGFAATQHTTNTNSQQHNATYRSTNYH
jgi:hypothetical protein